MTHEPGLTEALRRRADQVGHTHPLSLEDVQGRARGLRRRRAAVSGLAVAAVLAVAAPIGLTLGDSPADRGDTPAVASSGVKDGILTGEVDAPGGELQVPYLYDGKIHLPDGGAVAVDHPWTGFDTLGDGYVVTDGSRFAVLDGEGEVVVEQPTSGFSFAVSPDHTLVAHVSDGRLQTLDAAGQVFETPVPDGIQTPEVVGIRGSESCDPEDAGGGCVIFVNDAGGRPAAYSQTTKGIGQRLGPFRSLSDVSDEQSVSGVISVDELEPGSCSEVWSDPFAGKAEWSTCEHTVGAFSPDGQLVVGHPAYRDGIGDASVAILDATDGTVLAEWTNSEEHQSFVGGSAWDADGTLLATVFEEGSWSVMRFNPDGGLSKVMNLGSVEDTDPGLVLPGAS